MKKYFKYNYQDAYLLKFTFLANDDLVLNIKLDDIMNPNGPIDAEVTFHQIQNIYEIKKTMMNFEKIYPKLGALDGIHSISKVANYIYLIEFFNNENLNIVLKSANFNAAIEEL